MRRLAPAATMAAAWALTLAADDRISDLYVYSVVAELVRDGAVPYRDFAFEYPPGALVPLAGLGGSETGWALAALAALLALQLAAPRARWWLVLVPLLAGALVRTKFDLLPAVLAVAGITALERRPRAAGVLFGLGALVKLWPALLLALRPARGVLVAGAATIAAGCLPFVVAGGFPDVMADFHLERPVQIESTPASVLFALGGSEVTGTPQRPDRFKSNGLDGGAAEAVRALFAVLQAAAVGGLALLAARRPHAPALGALAVVLAFVALGAVLSPQYLLWLLPLAALVAASGHLVPAALVAAAAVLTRLWFPARYFDLVARDDAVVALVAVRNLLLVTALGATARALTRSRPPGAAGERCG